MTFLELCQMVSRESGTISGNLPSTTQGQVDRLAKVVYWTQYSWKYIQNKRNAWRWMRREFSGQTSASTARYTPAALGITNLAEWLYGSDRITIYKTANGAGDERPMTYLPWDDWRIRFNRGLQDEGYPQFYTISPQNELCLGPTPDGTYTIRGEYRKTPQALSENGDTPEMPERFHEVIAWKGLLLLAEHDEAQLHIAVANERYRDLMGELERDQLPQFSLAGPLA